MAAFRMNLLNRIAGLCLAALLALIAVGCGGASSANPGAAAAKTQIKIGDAPADSVLAFELKITSISLSQQGGGSVNVLSTPAEIELSHLAGMVEPLAVANAPSGTYTGASVSVSNVEVTYIPSGSSTPVEKQFALSATITVPFNPAITLGSSASVLNFDVNLAQSLSFDAGGNVTSVNPVFSVSNSSVAPQAEQEDDDGKIDGLVGMVSTVTPANGNTPASFAITSQSGSPAQAFSVSSTTEFGDGLAQFADLKVGMMIKVDATTQTDGSLLAKEVELLEANDGEEADGIVTATTGNPATSLSLLVQDDLGNASANQVGTSISVNVGNATFKSPLTDSDFSNLLQGLPFTPKFDNTTIAAGQRVEVNGASATPMQGSLVANEVKLQGQALTGTVAAPAAGSTASFVLLLDANSAFVKLTGISSLNVYEVSATQLKGIASVAQGAQVRVRGLLLFDGTNYQFVAARITQP